MVLGICVDILFLLVLYQSFNIATVSSSLSIGGVSQGLLYFDGSYRRILSGHVPYVGLCLRPSCFFLGSNHCRDLREPQGSLVREQKTQYCSGRQLMMLIRFTNASINIVTDICTGVLPLPTLNSLNLPRRQKYALMAVFALGGL